MFGYELTLEQSTVEEVLGNWLKMALITEVEPTKILVPVSTMPYN